MGGPYEIGEPEMPKSRGGGVMFLLGPGGPLGGDVSSDLCERAVLHRHEGLDYDKGWRLPVTGHDRLRVTVFWGQSARLTQKSTKSILPLGK